MASVGGAEPWHGGHSLTEKPSITSITVGLSRDLSLHMRTRLVHRIAAIKRLAALCKHDGKCHLVGNGFVFLEKRDISSIFFNFGRGSGNW